MPSYAFFTLLQAFYALLLDQGGLDLHLSGGSREKRVDMCIRGKK